MHGQVLALDDTRDLFGIGRALEEAESHVRFERLAASRRIERLVKLDQLDRAVGRRRIEIGATRRWRLIVPDFGVLEGAFLVAALEYAGEHEGEASFALSLASAGEISFSAL